jgi:hypothetical protein
MMQASFALLRPWRSTLRWGGGGRRQRAAMGGGAAAAAAAATQQRQRGSFATGAPAPRGCRHRGAPQRISACFTYQYVLLRSCIVEDC